MNQKEMIEICNLLEKTLDFMFNDTCKGIEYKSRTRKILQDNVGEIPEINEGLFFERSLYIDSPERDFEGGYFKVAQRKVDISGGKLTWFVKINEKPNTWFNFKSLLEEQEKLKEYFGKVNK